MKKSIYILFLFLCVGLSFAFAPSAENIFKKNAFRIVKQVNSQGNIALTYVFPLNTQEFKKLGLKEENFLVYKFYLTSYVNALANNNKQKETEGASVGDCVYFSDLDGLGFTIIFEDLQAQKRFFGVTDNEGASSSDYNFSGFFIKTAKIETTFPIGSQDNADNFKSVCQLALDGLIKNVDIDKSTQDKLKEVLNSSVFIYDFATQSSALKSELSYEDEYFYHNVFIKTYEDLAKDNKIVFWQTYPNKPVWYLTALGVVLICMTIALLVIKKKNKKI